MNSKRAYKLTQFKKYFREHLSKIEFTDIIHHKAAERIDDWYGTDEAVDCGMAYTFPARYGPMHPLDKVIVTAYVRKADSNKETIALAEYAHATISLIAGISVGINGTNISFSAVGLLDTMARSLYFKY